MWHVYRCVNTNYRSENRQVRSHLDGACIDGKIIVIFFWGGRGVWIGTLFMKNAINLKLL